MDNENRIRREFVEKLAAENREFYGTQDGLATLRTLELTFEHRWIYLFELVQNALDAGARSIALGLAEDGNALIFQHDGFKALEKKDVEGLSKVFRSTKGASSVGFMGIGFKSVFGRFREARISGWGWTFRYKMSKVVGSMYGDVQSDLLGAVIPIWDDTIAKPESGFTTRFEMRRLVGSAADLRSDLKHFLSDNDRILLAILAAAELKCLKLDGHTWELGINKADDGSIEATALSEDEDLLWQLFPVQYKPSPEAIRCFLEHRKIRPSEEECEQVYAEAARIRRVLGVLPLDDRGIPVPPTRGHVYATLPTEVRVPFGLHINADWLLNISRTGLREIDDNSWQRDIVERIADVLASFLRWIANTYSDPDAIKAAFEALALPSREDSRLEALLLEGSWLSRLGGCLEHVAVLPVWTEQADTLAFAKPSEVIVPPEPLTKVFGHSPKLLPTVLMKGPVLACGVLGDGARKLLERTGFLNEMEPRDLERVWDGGLEYWWGALDGDESDRRKLLFLLWSAVAELTPEEDCEDIRIPCIRMDSGAWLPVDKTAFFNEGLPLDKEPGGPKVLQLIQSAFPDMGRYIPHDWINALRQTTRKEVQTEPLLRARKWIEKHSQSINLKEAIETAMGSGIALGNKEESVLISLGQWAKHRDRPDLLTHVLVGSENGLKGVLVREALVADPYVEQGKNRRILFPTISPISAVYVEGDKTNSNARDWRQFFERAGARGALKVRTIEDHANRRNRGCVAEFLGCDPNKIWQSNNAGYKLLDFDIEPDLPEPNASHASRAALASWLEDGFSALQDGVRQAKYHWYRRYYDLTGKRPSAWRKRLSELAWVPCYDDDQLRFPKNVLPEQDPAREDVPVAQLSHDLVEALKWNGVKFGVAIPEAAPLRKLVNLGSQLGAEELAELLRECREEIATDEDRTHFEHAARELDVPCGDRRFPLNRIVQHARSGGHHRSTLGGWILPLTKVHESLREELEHPEFPYEFPENTTGEQALAYLCDVWARARSSPERLANEVRDFLPYAYAYCLEDMGNDGSLKARWDDTVRHAAVFAEREWVFPNEAAIYLDDIEDRRFFPNRAELRIATGGHLGNSLEQRRCTANALGLKVLSSVIEMKWDEGGTLDVNDWKPRFDLVCQLLRHVRGIGRAEEESVRGY